MRYFFVFALFLFKVADAGYTCPSEEGLFPHMTKCSWFIQCMNWYPYVFECPSGLHFDQTKKLCDWPSQAGCTLEEEDSGTQDADQGVTWTELTIAETDEQWIDTTPSFEEADVEANQRRRDRNEGRKNNRNGDWRRHQGGRRW